MPRVFFFFFLINRIITMIMISPIIDGMIIIIEELLVSVVVSLGTVSVGVVVSLGTIFVSSAGARVASFLIKIRSSSSVSIMPPEDAKPSSNKLNIKLKKINFSFTIL